MRTDRPSLWQLALVRASDKEANRPSPGDNVPGSVDIVRLLPGTRTPILHGSTNERLTAHLCLHGCNQPGQHIALHDGTARVVPFKAGEAIVWDDSFAHELVYEPAARTANGAASASEHALADEPYPPLYFLRAHFWHPALLEEHEVPKPELPPEFWELPLPGHRDPDTRKEEL